MKPTRQRLVDYLRAHTDVTASELAHRLRLTHADVRYHLNLLLVEGVIAVTGQRVMGRGRPARSYRLASGANQQRFDLLSSALLAEAFSGHSPAEDEAFLRRLANRLGKDEGGRMKDEKKRHSSFDPHPLSLSARLVNAVSHLNDLGYSARWEAHADSPRLILEHCPFSSLHAEHPALQRLEVFLIEELLDTKILAIPGDEKAPGKVYAVMGSEFL